MVERIKMARIKRASQFAPFDALKGLSEALRIKEFEHDKIVKGDMSDTDAENISNTLMDLEKGDSVCIKYFRDGHESFCEGFFFPNYEDGIIEVRAKLCKYKIKIDELISINSIKKD